MSFKRILIAVDESPTAAHAAEVGVVLARSLGAEVAFVCVVDPGEIVAADTGVPAAEMIALAERDGRDLLRQFRQRVSPALARRNLSPSGSPRRKS